jgi:predicted AAA+ superfamily ATPase
MGFHVPAARLRRLWTLLAHLQGETVNYSRLAANLEVDAKTVSHYIDTDREQYEEIMLSKEWRS